jgi:hypothetical protein
MYDAKYGDGDDAVAWKDGCSKAQINGMEGLMMMHRSDLWLYVW